MDVAARTAQRACARARRAGVRKARVCYDHLAGELGVHVYDSPCGVFSQHRQYADARLRRGRFFDTLGVDVEALARERRPLCRACLDWSMRRHHLAGAVGAALLGRCFDLNWACRDRVSRAVHFTPAGERNLARLFVLPGV